MASKEFESKLEEELHFWAVRVFDRIKKNFVDYSINRAADRKNGYTGDLYRRMWWDVHNAAGGNKALKKTQKQLDEALQKQEASMRRIGGIDDFLANVNYP